MHRGGCSDKAWPHTTRVPLDHSEQKVPPTYCSRLPAAPNMCRLPELPQLTGSWGRRGQVFTISYFRPHRGLPATDPLRQPPQPNSSLFREVVVLSESRRDRRPACPPPAEDDTRALDCARAGAVCRYGRRPMPSPSRLLHAVQAPHGQTPLTPAPPGESAAAPWQGVPRGYRGTARVEPTTRPAP